MPIYEYRCKCGKKFEKLRLMSQYSEPSTCTKCGKEADRIISNAHFRMAESFRVVDSDGNVTQEKQVVNNMPDLKDTKPKDVPPRITLPILSRDGNVYYPRRDRYATS